VASVAFRVVDSSSGGLLWIQAKFRIGFAAFHIASNEKGERYQQNAGLKKNPPSFRARSHNQTFQPQLRITSVGTTFRDALLMIK
jgi:hypothetical protein